MGDPTSAGRRPAEAKPADFGAARDIGDAALAARAGGTSLRPTPRFWTRRRAAPPAAEQSPVVRIGDGAPAGPRDAAATSAPEAPASAAEDPGPARPARAGLLVDAGWRRAARNNAIYAARLGWRDAMRDVTALVGASQDDPGAESLARAVAEWQRREGLAADGVIGPETWSRLQSRLRASSRLSRGAPSVRRLIEKRWMHDNPAPQVLALSRDAVLLWNFPLDGAALAPEHAEALTGFVAERLRRVGAVFRAFRVVVRVNGVASSSELPDMASARADAAARLLIRHFAVRAGDMIEVSASSAPRPVTSEKTGRGFAMNRSVRARLVFLQR